MYIFKVKLDPDTGKCQTTKAGAVIPVAAREMYYCGLDNADCQYAMQLGWDYICKHPDNASFCAVEEPEDGLADGCMEDCFSTGENLRQ